MLHFVMRLLRRRPANKLLHDQITTIRNIVGPTPVQDLVIDEGRLPLRKAKLKVLVWDELCRIGSTHSAEEDARFLARCYVDLARFQDGYGAADKALQGLFESKHHDSSNLLKLAPYTSRIQALRIKAGEEMEVARAELVKNGWGALLVEV